MTAELCEADQQESSSDHSRMLQPEQVAALDWSDRSTALESLAASLLIKDHLYDARASAHLDFAYGLLEFCHSIGLSSAKSAAVWNASSCMLEEAAGGSSLQQASQRLKQQLAALCCAYPTDAGAKLSADQVGLVARHLAATALQHYKLYRLVYSRQQEHVQHVAELLVESPADVLPLDQAMGEQDWAAHQQAQAAQQEQERQAQEAAAAAAAAAEAAAQKQRALEAEQEERRARLAVKPATLDEAVELLVAARLDEERTKLAAAYQEREAALLAKVAQLEALMPGGGAANGASSSAGARPPAASNKSK